MIRAIEIENFKCIGGRQRIEFAPITLLFGPNSAGKSTVIQALAYFHHLLNRGTIDAVETDIKGDNLRLGTYEELLHRHERDRRMRISIELSGNEGFPEIPGCLEPAGINLRGAEIGLSIEIESEDSSYFCVSLDGIEAGRLGFSIVRGGSFFLDSINWYHPRFLHEREYLDEVVSEINGKRRSRSKGIVSLRNLGVAKTQSDELIEILIDGRSLATNSELGNRKLMGCSLIAELMTQFFDRRALKPDGSLPGHFLSSDQFGYRTMKDYGGKVPVPLRSERLRFEDNDPFSGDPKDVADEWVDLGSALTSLFVGAAELARKELDIFRLGPLRRIPPRSEEIVQKVPSIRQWRWSPPESDLWRSLLFSRSVDQVNEWLNREDRIDLGISVRVSQYVLVDTDDDLGKSLCAERPASQYKVDFRKKPWRHAELGEFGRDLQRQIQIQLIDSRFEVEVKPEDVGVGVSQVVPLVVHAVTLVSLDPGISCVEQPELHLHPKAQLALADMFIESGVCEDTEHCWIIETHSEHLLLRLLRRVRETCNKGLEPGDFPLKPEQLSVIYIELGETGTLAHRLHVDEDGDFEDRWPEGFFEERNQELF